MYSLIMHKVSLENNQDSSGWMVEALVVLCGGPGWNASSFKETFITLDYQCFNFCNYSIVVYFNFYQITNVWGCYLLANFQLLLISGLRHRCDNILVLFFCEKSFIVLPILFVFKPNLVPRWTLINLNPF